jgi:hypothetical protein
MTMNTTFKFKFFSLLFISLLLFAGCRKKDKVEPTTPPPGGQPVDQELITTLILHFESMDGTEQLSFTSRDLDGEGGQPAVITVQDLTPNTMYHVHAELLDESKNPVEDITQEIQEEGDHHQFFYLVTGASVSIAYADEDEDGLPIGLHTIWTVGDVSSGNVRVILRHDLDKGAAGVSDGDISNAGGDTDIQVDFPLNVVQ